MGRRSVDQVLEIGVDRRRPERDGGGLGAGRGNVRRGNVGLGNVGRGNVGRGNVGRGEVGRGDAGHRHAGCRYGGLGERERAEVVGHGVRAEVAVVVVEHTGALELTGGREGSGQSVADRRRGRACQPCGVGTERRRTRTSLGDLAMKRRLVVAGGASGRVLLAGPAIGGRGTVVGLDARQVTLVVGEPRQRAEAIGAASVPPAVTLGAVTAGVVPGVHVNLRRPGVLAVDQGHAMSRSPLERTVRASETTVESVRSANTAHLVKTLPEKGGRPRSTRSLPLGHGVERDQPIGHRRRLDPVVGDVHRGGAEGAQDAPYVADEPIVQVGVEGPERLVEEHHARAGGECSRQGDALGLATGQGGHVPPLEARQPDECQQLGDARSDGAARHPRRSEPVGDVVVDVEVREQHVVLEHETDAASMGRLGGHVEPVDRHRAVRRHEQAGDDAEQRRLPAAARTDDAHDLAVGHREVDGVEHAASAVLDGDRAHVEAHAAGLTMPVSRGGLTGRA